MFLSHILIVILESTTLKEMKFWLGIEYLTMPSNILLEVWDDRYSIPQLFRERTKLYMKPNIKGETEQRSMRRTNNQWKLGKYDFTKRLHHSGKIIQSLQGQVITLLGENKKSHVSSPLTKVYSLLLFCHSDFNSEKMKAS